MKRILRTQLWLAIVLTLGLPFGSVQAKSDPAVTAIQLPEKDVKKRFMTSIYPMNTDASVNIVIDAAAKTKNPAKMNYSAGKVPRSILAKEKNGDGEPLKAVVLGTPRAAGAVLKGRPLALITKLVRGKQQTLLVVTTLTSIYGSAQTLDQIEAQTPGTMAQLKSAFAPVKAVKCDEVIEVAYESKGRKETIRLLGDAISDFDSAFVKESDKRPLDNDGNPQLYLWPGARNIGE